jgi:hypothetical protein
MATDTRRSHFLAALLGALVVALPILGLAIGGAFTSADPAGVAATVSPSPVASAPAATAQAPAAGSSTKVAPARSPASCRSR